jgi:SAM-dependent MidA family methyltransferase
MPIIDSKIRQLILETGYITVDNMMREVLSNNHASYYRQQNLIGVGGDFTTAPEISQLFGEIIGLWCIDQWHKLGCPKETNLVELGPGRGMLLRDLLKVAKLVPEFYDSLAIELVDINPNFIECQKKILSQFDLKIRWLKQVDDIAHLPSIIIANEFFDALPIKQYIKIKELWYESILIVDANDNKIKFDKIALSKKLQDQLLYDHRDAHEGAVIEKSPIALEIVSAMSDHIKKFSGASLIIDYGYDIDIHKRTRYQYQSTLQAVKNHQYYSLLETLGKADLSAHVDFSALKNTAQGRDIKTYGAISQRDFLIDYGIALRSQVLQKKLPLAKAQIVARQTDYLISPIKMGELFKALYLFA